MDVFDWIFEILHFGDFLSAWRFVILLLAGISLGWYLYRLLGGDGLGILAWIVCGLFGAIAGGLWHGKSAHSG